MAVYFRTAEMGNGGPFHCFNCGKKLAVKVKGNCHVQFLCPRCKAFIDIKMKEAINWNKEAVEESPPIVEGGIKVGGSI